MQHRLDELLEFIMKEMAGSLGLLGRGDRVRQLLTKKGYKQTEIDAALQMIQAVSAQVAGSETTVYENVPADGSRPTYRVLSPWEQAKLTVGAQQQLMRLERAGLLLPEEREAVLERAMEVEGMVDGEEMRALVAWTVFPTGDAGRYKILLELIDDTGSNGLPVH